MRNRQGKCPGCGLTNFRDAAECQWCALALSGRTRNELVDDMPAPAGKPWGLLLMLFAFVVVGGGVLWHVAQKVAARVESTVEAAETEDANPNLPKRAGPPSLSGRSPSDRPGELTPEMMDRAIEARQRDMQKFAEANPHVFRNRDREAHDVARRAVDEYNATLRRKLDEKRREALRRAEAEEEEAPPPVPDDPDDR